MTLTTCRKAQLSFSVPGHARLTKREVFPATLSRLIRLSQKSAPKSPTSASADLDEKRVLTELDSDNPENVSTPNRTLGSVEFDTNSDSEKPHFSKTLGKYLTHLKMIKRPKIKNSELLAGVDQVSRSIEGCIKLAETALGSSTSRRNPEVLNPSQKRSGDIFSGTDRVYSKLADCIKIAESTLQNKEQKSGGGIAGDLVRQTPGLFG